MNNFEKYMKEKLDKVERRRRLRKEAANRMTNLLKRTYRKPI
jgi:hypothetical protein